MVFNDVLQHLYKRYASIIEWHPSLTYERMTEYALDLNAANDAIPGVWGFLDGTFRPVCRPTTTQERFYSGYKKRHGFKYQAIVTPDGLVLSAMGPKPGNIHDKTIFDESGLENRLRAIQYIVTMMSSICMVTLGTVPATGF
jgi:DDE superfamily endonuclease